MKARHRQAGEGVNWEKARQRLDEAKLALAAIDKPTREQARQVMDERARRLAEPPPQAPTSANLLRLLTFSLADELYGIETTLVSQIVRRQDCTPVPGTPDFLLGVTNLRGEILAIVDLGKVLGVASRGLTDLSRIVVLGREPAEFGVLADAVHEVITVRREEVLEAPATFAGVGREFLCGVTKEALIVLEGEVLLKDGRFFIHQA